MEGLRRKGHAVADALDRASEAHITDANGTDLTLDLSGRRSIPDAGELTEPGAFGNLPCGEGFISPAGGNGTLVIAAQGRSGQYTRRLTIVIKMGG